MAKCPKTLSQLTERQKDKLLARLRKALPEHCPLGTAFFLLLVDGQQMEDEGSTNILCCSDIDQLVLVDLLREFADGVSRRIIESN